MKKRFSRLAVFLALTVASLAAFAAIAADAGSQGDPLVTLSYLRDVFTGEILTKTDAKLEERNAALTQEMQRQIAEAQQTLLGQAGGSAGMSGTAESYTAVTVIKGQTLWIEMGGEVLLRSGKAVCRANGETPGLLDATDGGTLADGSSLKENHLYLLPGQRGIAAGEDAVVLVRGTYSVY